MNTTPPVAPPPGSRPNRSKMRARARKRLRAQVLIVGVCLAISLGAFLGVRALAPQLLSRGDTVADASVPPPVDATPTPAPQLTVTKLSVAACGDNLIHDGLYLQARKRAGGEGYDFNALYEPVASFFKDYDINWINQETLVTDDFPPAGYPMFASPTAVADTLYNIGFRVFALSNNHSYDKGANGIASTRRFWGARPADVTAYGLYATDGGTEQINVQTVQDVKIAYVAYTESTNGLPTPSGAEASVIYTSQTDIIEQQIRKARTMADVVVVSVHWGTENSHVINDAQRTLAQQMSDWGADIILGTHPHVVQGVEWFTAAETNKQVPVYYSLGNFVSLQRQLDNLLGVIGTFDITKTTQPDGTGSVTIDNVKATPIFMHYDSGCANGRVYLLRDYTPELAAVHGAREYNGAFSIDYLHQVLQENFTADVLVTG